VMFFDGWLANGKIPSSGSKLETVVPRPIIFGQPNYLGVSPNRTYLGC
jgi:hypothetical protein